jgi:hypothetical protein
MRITYPVAIEMNDEDIEEGARACNMSQEDYRKGLLGDKLLCLKDHLENSSFFIDEARIEVEE